MQEIWDLVLYNFIGCLLVFARVMGIFIFNPIMARATVPMRIRVSMSIVLTLIMVAFIEKNGGTGIVGYIPSSTIEFVAVLVKEAALGYIFGFIVNLILTVIIYGGSIIDNQMTLSMAQAVDPTTGINMPVTGNLFYYMFIMYFFAAGGHLTYIELFAKSYTMLPIGFELNLNWVTFSYDISMFLGKVMILAVKMSMPIIASEMILQVCVGVIMKAVPSIQIFVINLQLKILLGFVILMIIASPLADFIDTLMTIMFENLFGTLDQLSGA